MKYEFENICGYLFYRGAAIRQIESGYSAKLCGYGFYEHITLTAATQKELADKIDEFGDKKLKDNIGNKKLFCKGSSNWDLYFTFDEDGNATFRSIPKPEELGCQASYFGDLAYVLKTLDKEEEKRITAAGRTLIKAKGKKENYLHVITA